MHLAPQELRTYFVSTTTANRRRLFQVHERAQLLLTTLLHYRDQHKFQLHAFVIMPDHLHAMLTPAPDVSLERALQFIKGGFSFHLKSKLGVWTPGFNESQIRTPEKYAAACKIYIELNPVRAGLCSSTEEYPFSSAAHPETLDTCPRHLQHRG